MKLGSFEAGGRGIERLGEKLVERERRNLIGFCGDVGGGGSDDEWIQEEVMGWWRSLV